MTLTKAIPVRNAAPAPLDGRLADMAMVVSNADGSPRTGVLGGASTTPTAGIVTTTATMNVAIAAAEFVTSKGKAEGVTTFTNNGTVNVLLDAPPATNSRIDVIYVNHTDNTAGDATSVPSFGFLKGTAAASPTKPTGLPTGAIELATIRLYAGTTATNGGTNLLTNTYQMTAARGGVVPVRNATERDAWTAPVDGQLVFVQALDATFQYLASAQTPGWYHVSGAPDIGGITIGGPSALWQQSASGGTAQMRKHSGMVIGSGSIQNNQTVSVALGSEYILGTITDASFRPDVDRFFATGTTSAATAGILTVKANGDVSWRANATATWTGAGTIRIDLGGVIFTQKGLI